MTGSIFDDFFDPDGADRPDAQRRSTPPAGVQQPPTAPFPAPGRSPEADRIPGAAAPGGAVPEVAAFRADAFGAAHYGEVPYMHTTPRTIRPLGRRVLVAAGSLAAGALAAGGAAYALTGGGDEPAVALASIGSSPSGAAEPVDDADRTQDVSRYEGRTDLCVRLDDKALAAIEEARAASADAAPVDGATVKVRTEDGDVVVSMAAVTVVQCTWPSEEAAATEDDTTPPAASSKTSKRSSSSSASSSSSSSSSSAPKPRSTTTTRPRTTTTSTRPKTTTTTRTTTRSSSSTKPRTTTTTSKTPTPKPTTSTAS
ncbi:hypothetical protein [Kineosporia sp. A_224]|uniref:hypothetical protein n=1 Tax=Kineosporia sp. A_224 TaxID=1962180 RepID=UPI000B4A5AC9|nr:hypothetical protein [Kineosporia sp. A_224]